MKKGFGKIPVSKLVKAKWNYKVEDKEKQKKLTLNLKRNGQVENIIVRETKGGKFEVVNGNHRLGSLKELKTKEAMCFNLGKITDAEAKRIAVETNETKFDSDYFKLASVVHDIVGEFKIDDLKETFPFSDTEISNMEKYQDWDWTEFEGKPKSKGEKKSGGAGAREIGSVFREAGITTVPNALRKKIVDMLKPLVAKCKEGQEHKALEQVFK